MKGQGGTCLRIQHSEKLRHLPEVTQGVSQDPEAPTSWSLTADPGGRVGVGLGISVQEGQ